MTERSISPRLTRRDVLFLGGLMAAASVGMRLRPFVEILGVPREVDITAEKLEPFIITEGNFTIPNSQNHEEAPISVGVNRISFAEAILEVAKISGMASPSKIYSLLEKKPLRISMVSEKSNDVRNKNTVIETDIHYRPYWYDGPELIFYENFLRSYNKAVSGLSFETMSLRYLRDTEVYHDIVHILQDMNNPIENTLNIVVSNIRQGVCKYTPDCQPDKLWEGDPLEIEAQKIAEAVALSKLKTFTDPNQEYPFGHFFTFS